MKKGLFDLPPEVRNQIYELALRHDVRPLESDSDAGTALLRASPQVHEEALEIHFRQATFVLELTAEEIVAGVPDASRWLWTLGHERLRYIQGLKISHESQGRPEFTLELRQTMVEGWPMLKVESLSVPQMQEHMARWNSDPSNQLAGLSLYGDTLAVARDSIDRALRTLFLDHREVDLLSFCGHNLVGGLARYMLGCVCKGDASDLALDFIMGTTWLERKRDGLLGLEVKIARHERRGAW